MLTIDGLRAQGGGRWAECAAAAHEAQSGLCFRRLDVVWRAEDRGAVSVPVHRSARRVRDGEGPRLCAGAGVRPGADHALAGAHALLALAMKAGSGDIAADSELVQHNLRRWLFS